MIGLNVEHRRLELGMTYEELAEKSGVNTTTIKRCISGRSNPKATTIARLAEALDVSCDYLFGDSRFKMRLINEFTESGNEMFTLMDVERRIKKAK